MGRDTTAAGVRPCRTIDFSSQRVRRPAKDPQNHQRSPMYALLPSRPLVAAAAVLMLISIPAAAQEKGSDAVVAKVNGQTITEADMRLADSELGSELGNLPPEIKRRALAEYLIDNMLFAEAAEAAQIATSHQFEEQMLYLRRRVLREQYFETTLRSTVSEDEAREIYNTRVAAMKPEDEFAARHILVDSEAKAKKLRAQIVAGADFAAVAKEHSTDPGSRDQGGFLGYFGKGQLVPEFEAVVVRLQEGEVSEPVKTSFGWHIIKLEDRRRKEPPTFESVKDTIVNSLVVRKAQERAAALRKKAKLEYVDADIRKQVEEQKRKEEAQAKAAAEGQSPGTGPAAAETAPAPKAEPAPKQD